MCNHCGTTGGVADRLLEHACYLACSVKDKKDNIRRKVYKMHGYVDIQPRLSLAISVLPSCCLP